jgi:hypothetical protein
MVSSNLIYSKFLLCNHIFISLENPIIELIIILNNGYFRIYPEHLQLVYLFDELNFLGGLQDYLDVLVF